MSCQYYWWNNHFACRKTGKDVNEDTYYRHCRGYDYSDCPIYKQRDAEGGCFLTSACVNAKGLPDNCRELMVLRAFRDTYMREIPGGYEDICEYYHIAPIIVERIRQRPDAYKVFEQIYNELVLPCVILIDTGKNKEAYVEYRSYTKKLQQVYISET